MPTLTKRLIDATRPVPSREVALWDDQARGFCLRVFPSGRKVFYCYYRLGGRGSQQRRQKLGPYGVLTVEQARRLAIDILRARWEGRDPAREKAEAQQRASVTLRQAIDAWMAESIGKRRASTLSLYRYLFRHLVTDELGKRPVALLAHAEIARWHAGHRATPAQANRALAALAVLFGWAMKSGLRPVAEATRAPASNGSPRKSASGSCRKPTWRGWARPWPMRPRQG